MVIEVRRKTAQIVLQDELAEERWIVRLHRNIPGQSDGTEKQDSGSPKSAEEQPQFARSRSIDHNHYRREKRCDWSFGQRAQRHASVERSKVDFLPARPPGPPAEHADGECRRQGHVGRSRASVAGDARARSGDERAIDLKAAPEAAQEEEHRQHEERGIEHRGQPCRPVVDAED